MDEDYLAKIIADREHREYLRRLGLMQQKGANIPIAPAPVKNALAMGPGPIRFGAYRLGQMADGRINNPDLMRQIVPPRGGNTPDHTYSGERDGPRKTIEQIIAESKFRKR